jgi:hypothetical protein
MHAIVEIANAAMAAGIRRAVMIPRVSVDRIRRRVGVTPTAGR